MTLSDGQGHLPVILGFFQVGLFMHLCSSWKISTDV